MRGANFYAADVYADVPLSPTQALPFRSVVLLPRNAFGFNISQT
jgi:hypothetical protein